MKGLFVAVARALAIAIAPILAWRVARRRARREVQRHGQAELLEHPDHVSQHSELEPQIELADHNLQMRSPSMSRRLRAAGPTRPLRAPSRALAAVDSPPSSSPDASPMEPSIRQRHRIDAIRSPRTDGPSFVSCECGWTCSADNRQQAHDELDAHLDAVVAGHERDDRRLKEKS